MEDGGVAAMFRAVLEKRLAGSGIQVLLPVDLVEAAREMARAGDRLVVNPDIDVGDWTTPHPDVAVLERWLAEQHDPKQELEVIRYLAIGVRTAWGMLPKQPSSKRRARLERVCTLCAELVDALAATGSHIERIKKAGLSGMAIRHLLVDWERKELGLDDNLPLTTEDLLARMREMAGRLAHQSPVHAQPAKRRAERGYFIRRMAALLQQRYGERPPEIIAALTTVALGEATDRELVTKHLT